MSYTCQDIITQVQNKIGDSSFSPTDILQYINHINRDVHNTYQLRYMQNSADYTTSTGVASLGTIPTDMQLAYNLRRTDKQYAGKLEYMPFDKFDERYPVPTLQAPSIPLLWYDYAQQIYLFPAPSLPTGLSGYGLELRYLKKPTTLTAFTQTPDIPEEFQEILTLGALKHAYERRQRFDVSQLMDQQYQAKVLELVQRYGTSAMAESDPYIMETPVTRVI